MERTLVLLKPDAVQRGLVGPILARFEQKALKIVGLKLRQFPTALIQRHYEAHKERPFYGALVDFMTSGPVMLTCLERENAVAYLREVIGATDPAQAAPGSIRKLYAESKGRNSVHASDSPASAEREVKLFFGVATLARGV